MKQEPCNILDCEIYSDIPAGTILPWVPKPSKTSTTEGLRIPDNWILCDGNQTCPDGLFINETCSNLSGRALIGTGIIALF